MLTLFARILKILNSEASPWQIGWAVALGILAGLLPFGLLTVVILLLVCLLTINLTTFLVTWGFSSVLVILLGPSLEALTWEYARQDALLQLLAGTETLQFLHLHHTLTLGGFVLGMLLLLPVAWLTSVLVKQYRSRLMQNIQKWKLVQMLKATKLVQLYEKLS